MSMSYTDIIIMIMEMIGTVAFAISGALTGIQKKMDLFGVNVLGVCTAVGGGMIRDLILGVNPPNMFIDSKYAFTAIGTSTALFLILYIRHKQLPEQYPVKYDRMLLFGDTIGLGIFTVVGCYAAVRCGFGEHRFLTAFVGVLTGVGGGMMRDIMAGNTPYILVKHVYAVASLAGAVVFTLILPVIGRLPAMIIGAVLVMILRFLAAHYRWNLPRIQ